MQIKDIFFTIGLVMLLSTCTSVKNKSKSNISVIITSTYQAEDLIYPFNQVDDFYASINRASEKKFDASKGRTKTLEEQLPVHSSTMENDHPLFSRCFMLQYKADDESMRLAKSSFLILSKEKDTAIINKYLKRAEVVKFFPNGIVFRWVKTILSDDAFALTAAKTNVFNIKMDTSCIRNILVSKEGGIADLLFFGKLAKQTMGVGQYLVALKLNDKGIMKLNSLENSEVNYLVEVQVNGISYFSSVKSSDLLKGISVGNGLSKTTVNEIKENFSNVIEED